MTTVSGGIAQLGERLNGIQEVMGSNPTISIKNDYEALIKKFDLNLNDSRIESASTSVGADFVMS